MSRGFVRSPFPEMPACREALRPWDRIDVVLEVVRGSKEARVSLERLDAERIQKKRAEAFARSAVLAGCFVGQASEVYNEGMQLAFEGVAGDNVLR